jgi:hypothetical protein
MSRYTTSFSGAVKVEGDGIYSATSAWGVLDLAGARLLSRFTTASAASTILDDGEIMITDVDADSAVLAFRSGATTYRWSSTTATVV